MSGHSKWAQIKHKKGAEDKKRGQVFSKLGRVITVAAKLGGPDPDTNPQLRSAIEKAQEMNMPKDNIERAINKATGTGNESLTEMLVEAYGPEGAAIIIKAITDNKNRTIQELRHVLDEFDGKLAGEGSVLWLFNNLGRIELAEKTASDQDAELLAIEAGAEDVKTEDNKTIIFTKPDELDKVKTNLLNQNLKIESAELEFVPKNSLPKPDEQTCQKIERLFEALDGLDDVQEIYTNIDL